MNIEYFINNNVEAKAGNTGHINDKTTVAVAAESAKNMEDMARGEGRRAAQILHNTWWWGGVEHRN